MGGLPSHPGNESLFPLFYLLLTGLLIHHIDLLRMFIIVNYMSNYKIMKRTRVRAVIMIGGRIEDR